MATNLGEIARREALVPKYIRSGSGNSVPSPKKSTRKVNIGYRLRQGVAALLIPAYLAVGAGLAALVSPNEASAQGPSDRVSKSLLQRLFGIPDYKVVRPEIVDKIPQDKYNVTFSEDPASTPRYNAVLFQKGDKIELHHSLPRQYTDVATPDKYLEELTRVSFVKIHEIRNAKGSIEGYVAAPSGTLVNVWYDTKTPNKLIVTTNYTSFQAPGSGGTTGGGTAGAGGGTGGCFTADTGVLMADGSFKPIDSIKIDEEVKSFDFNNNKIVSNKVAKLFNVQTDSFLLINNNLKVTDKHPFAVGFNKWKQAAELKVGDKIMGNSFTEIKSIKRILRTADVFNLSVNGTMNYYVSDGKDLFLVHNKGGGG